MSKPSKEEVYQRIRETSREEVILEEMQRLGFWSPDEDKPDISDLLERERELEETLRELIAEQEDTAEDPDEALAQIHEERKREARKRREETKQRRKEERRARAEAWEERKKQHITYLGEGVSEQLDRLEGDTEALARHDLPAFPDHPALADALGISMDELRFLAYHRKVSSVTHYYRFRMPKKRGGFRDISAPMPRLKRAQRWILDHLLKRVPLRDEAHGFREDRSIVSNAEPHVGQDLVINLDIEDFFPTVTLWRVYGVFESLGYSPSISTILALLCTELPVDEVELDGRTWYAARGPRHLPQGGPASPAITNILCRRMDARLAGIADKHGFTYTRYADDLTFSASGSATEALTTLLWHVKTVVDEEGFELRPDKERIMRKGQRQEVTGLVVNDSVSVPREDVRRFRALLHRIRTEGLERAHWKGENERLLDRMHGFSSYLEMVDAERYADLRGQAREILDAHGYSPQPVPPQSEAEENQPAEPTDEQASDFEESTTETDDSDERATEDFWSMLKRFFTGGT